MTRRVSTGSGRKASRKFECESTVTLPGPFECYLITPANVASLHRDIAAGDRTAGYVADTIDQAITAIAARSGDDRAMCMCLDCATRFDANELPISFVVTLPSFPEGKFQGLANGICRQCAGRGDLMELIMTFMRRASSDIGRPTWQ
jgi:hypothetical protein